MILAALFLVASQAGPPPKSGQETGHYTAEEGAQFAQAYGHCLAQSAPKSVTLLLKQEPYSANADRVYTNLIGSSGSVVCRSRLPLRDILLGATFLKMEPIVVRGALAEGLIPKATQPMPAHPGTGSFSLHVFATRDKGLDERVRLANGVLYGIADCVVLTQPDKVATLVQTVGQSAEERQKMGDLQPAIAGCVPPDQTVSLDRRRLRSALAEALYVSVHVPTAAVMATAAGRQE